MNKRNSLRMAIIASSMFSTMVFAENSEAETPPDEYELARQTNPMPDAVKTFISGLQDMDARYPDSGAVDIDAFMAAEGERLALNYCGAMGFKGACTVEMKDGIDTFIPVSAAASTRTAQGRGKWWQWLFEHLFNVGVIPEQAACPAPYTLTQIHMDDEDRRNANGRDGWIGAIISNNNTTYRFCKLDTFTSFLYRPLAKAGDDHDYAVLNMGVLCPSGARRVLRVEENELWRNASSSSGDNFPNVRVYNTWFNFYCHFDGGANSVLGHMQAFPKLGFAHGVFAPSELPAPYAMQHGWVFQDDEDTLNWNAWIFGSGHSVMNGGRNTWRGTAKVE